MIFLAKQKLGESLSESLEGEVALDHPRVTNRNLPILLRDHQGNGVRFLGKSETRTMSETQSAVEVIPLGQGKNTTCRHDSVAADNHTAIVQNRLGMKNCQEELL